MTETSQPLAISDAQLAANRANAQLSTGPTTSEGKAISSRNNLRHGLNQTDGALILVEDESENEYLESVRAFEHEWKPATATEQDLVQRLASNRWLRRRALGLQRNYISSVDGSICDAHQFALYRRYEMTLERAYNKALGDLMRLRSLRLREQIGFESQQRKTEEHSFKIRRLQDREKVQQISLRAAELRASHLECKLQLAMQRLHRSEPAVAVPS